MRRRRTAGQVLYGGGQGGVAPSGAEWRAAGVSGGASSGGRDIVEALAGAGGIINGVLAREYVAGREAEADEVILGVRREFEEWKSVYNRENQGRRGVNALRDYAARYDELAARALEEHGGPGNEVFGARLERKLAENGLFAVKEGNAFAERQRELWLASQLQAQMRDFGAYVAANPEDGDGIAYQRKMLLESWQAKNPGLDAGGFVAGVNELEFKNRMESLLARGDTAGARALLAGGLAAPGPDAPLAEWTKAANNPGNVTVDGVNFAAYATPEDGIKAIYGRFASYHKKGKKTPAAIISTYAPPAENDTAAYIRNVAQWTGLEPEREIDIRDAATLARLAAGVLRQENSLDMPRERLEAIARDFLANGEPKATGVIPRSRAARRAMAGLDRAMLAGYQGRLESLEKAERAAAWRLEADNIIASINRLPEDFREEELRKVVSALPIEKREVMAGLLKSGVADRLKLDHFVARRNDQEMLDRALDEYSGYSDEARAALVMNMSDEIRDAARRDSLMQYGLSRLKHERDRAIANDSLEARNFLEQNGKLAPAEFQAALEQSNLSANARQRALELAHGPASADSLANIQATADALMLIDAGELQGPEERMDYARQAHLTTGQTRRLLEYGGAAGQISMARVNSCLAQLLKSGDVRADSTISGDNTLSLQAYELVLENLPRQGRPVTDQDIQNTLATLLTGNGGLLWNRKSIMEQLAAGSFDSDWLPEIKPHERKQLADLLTAQGIDAGERNMRLLKKINLFHKHNWQINFDQKFE